MRLYVIRHGKTWPTGDDSRTWSLAPEGVVEAEVLAEAPFWKGVAALYSSPEEKALATVRPAAERYGLDIRQDERLTEVGRPAKWIENYDDAVRAYLEAPDERRDEWESYAAARDRTAQSVSEIVARHPEGAVALCGHGMAWTLYLEAVDPHPLGPFEAWCSIGFGTVAVVEDGAVAVRFSPVEELE